MLEILREMCTLAGKLKDFINETENEEEKKILWERYEEINKQIEKFAGTQFDENDDFFRDTIDKILDTERVFKDFKANQIKLINVFVYLIDIIANVEKIILGWKTGNGK